MDKNEEVCRELEQVSVESGEILDLNRLEIRLTKVKLSFSVKTKEIIELSKDKNEK